jgi:uncharacterized protein YkwD
MKSIMFFLSFIFAVITSCTKESVSVTNNEPVPATVNKTVLLQLVNDARKKGCNCGNTYYAPAPALTWNDQLEKAAYIHASDMYQKKYFSHTGSDGSGSGERISAVGYSWKFYGENIAAGYQTEKEVISGWLSSPGHCANIMNKNFREMGVARAGDYWTQDFGSR